MSHWRRPEPWRWSLSHPPGAWLLQDAEGGVLRGVLERTPYPFALELAALASRQQLLDLPGWVAERVTSQGLSFVQATLQFLADKLAAGAVQPATTASLLVRHAQTT